MNQTIFNITKPRVSIFQPSAPATPKNLLDTIRRSLNTAAENQFKQWQKAVIKKSEQEGELEGAQKQPEYRDNGSLSSEAFNEAAKRSYLTRLEIEASKNMQTIKETYKNDPEGYQNASNQYINGIVSGLRQNTQTAAVAEFIKARLELSQQSDGYAISKNYMSNQSEKIEVETDELIHTLNTNAYRESGGLFSKDPNVQAMTIENFSIAKKSLETALYTTLPDGTPVYSPTEVKKIMNEFHEKFYIRAVQDYVAQNDITDKELNQIIDGSFSANIEGVGDINILNEVGFDKYENDIRDWTFRKIREKESAEQKSNVLEEKTFKEIQKQNGVLLIGGILSGDPITLDSIYQKLDSGLINSTDAMAAVKLITDLHTGSDDPDIVADLKTKLALGQEVETEIKQLSPYMTGKTYISLMEENANVKAGKIDEAETWLVKQVLRPDEFGFSNPESQKQAADIQTAYRQMIEDGIDQQVAYEKAQTLVDTIQKDYAAKLSRIPRYAVPDGLGGFDIVKTLEKTEQAYKEGKISYDEMIVEGKKLKALSGILSESE